MLWFLFFFLWPFLLICDQDDPMCVCAVLSCFSWVQFFVILWTVAHQAPLSEGFSRQEYWSGLPCPPPWDLPNPGIELTSLMSPALADGFLATSATWESQDDPVYQLTLYKRASCAFRFLSNLISKCLASVSRLFNQPVAIISKLIFCLYFSLISNSFYIRSLI